jgi:hypothetical protein
MTFGLKNAGATYQKAIQKCLQVQIGRNAEAYVDDIVIKTRSNDQFIAVLQEIFEKSQEIKIEAEPHQVRIRHPGQEATRLHHKQSGHRSQPNKDQRYQIHEATQVQEGSDEAYRVHGGPEPVHHLTRR